MEATTNTLADALLDDIDDLSDVEEEEDESVVVEVTSIPAAEETEGGSSARAPAATATAAASSSRTAGRRFLLHDAALQKHLQAIRKSEASKQSSSSDNNEADAEQEHALIVHSNKQLARLAHELSVAHAALCSAYKPKLPEMEELLPHPVQYKNAVRIIGNEMDLSGGSIPYELGAFLTSNQILTISVTASTTSGRPLLPHELKAIDQALQDMEDILQIQTELQTFVEHRMEQLAPNVCALVGPAVAAQLVALSGGLEELSKIPSCNLQVLGQVKQSGASRGGMSSATTRPNEGILSECDLVQQCPRQLQKKALKTVAAKLALAARCDFVTLGGIGGGTTTAAKKRDATSGVSFRQEIESKFLKWQEPDKAPTLKALPKPDLTIKRRRGGRRIRRMKEKFEETAMMKQANTRAFSTQAGEYGDDAMGLGLGLLDSADIIGGAMRKTTEKRKMRTANTKASRKRAAQMTAAATASGGTATSGLASSMVFTPVQGMELVNPDANRERVKEANRKWFSENEGFRSALPKK